MAYLRNVTAREATSRGTGPLGNNPEPRKGCWPVDAPATLSNTNIITPPVAIGRTAQYPPALNNPILDANNMLSQDVEWTKENACFMQHGCVYDLYLHFNSNETDQPWDGCLCDLSVIFSWAPPWTPLTRNALSTTNEAFTRYVLGNKNQDVLGGIDECSHLCNEHASTLDEQRSGCWWHHENWRAGDAAPPGDDAACRCVYSDQEENHPDCPSEYNSSDHYYSIAYCVGCRHVYDGSGMSEEKASAFAHTSPYCCSRFNVVPDGEFGRGEAWIRWDMEEYYGSDPLFTAAVDGGLPVWVTFVARADERGVYQFHEHESNPAYAASFLSVPKSPAYKKITCPASGTSQACYDTADDTPTEIGYQALKTVCDTLFKS